MHIQIRLGTKFEFKLQFWFVWIKLAQKGYFGPKTEKVNITIELCIFKVV